jgi:gamma-glutamylputrescine oxidase
MHGQLGEPPSYWHTTVPTLLLSKEVLSQANVVVIGAGWPGTSTAYWASQTGASVVLLDRQGFAAGATGRNGGFMGCGPDEPYQDAVTHLGEQDARIILDITLENRALLRHILEKETISCDYREPGHLHLALTGQQMAEHRQSCE